MARDSGETEVTKHLKKLLEGCVGKSPEQLRGILPSSSEMKELERLFHELKNYVSMEGYSVDSR